MKHQDLTDWTGIPAATAKATFSALQIQQSPDLSRGFVIKYDPIGDLTGLASKPAPWVRNSQTPKTTKGRDKNDLSMFGTGRRTDWTGTPAVTAKATFFCSPDTTKPRRESRLCHIEYGTGRRT